MGSAAPKDPGGETAPDANAGASTSLPSDALRIHQLIKSMGIDDYEPRVVNQLMDFMYKYVTDILLDAEAYSEQANKAAGVVEMDDVMLGIQSRTAYSFVQPPSQDIISEMAQRVNAKEMPKFPAQKVGLLIPEDKEQLTAQNYQYMPGGQ